VNLAGTSVFLVNTADLSTKKKTHLGAARFRDCFIHRFGQERFEFIESRFSRLELCLQLSQPARMYTVTSSHHGYTFELSPPIQTFGFHGFTGGHRVMGVDMKIG
jgi:hypothetical protein